MAAAVAVSIVLLIADNREQRLEGLRSALSLFVYPVQYLVDLPVGAVRSISMNLQQRGVLEEENARLNAEQLLFKTQLQRLTALQVENMRLRALLGSSAKLGERVFIAELLAVDLDPYSHQVIINKGKSSGLFIGQPVLDAEGIMGQVVHVTPLTATVMLITDPSHALPVQVSRNGLRTVALGTGHSNRLDLPYLPNNADIRQGDLLVTSGLGKHFPAGYPVARVAGVKQKPGQPFAAVEAIPAAHLERSREVLLVRKDARENTNGNPAQDDSS